MAIVTVYIVWGFLTFQEVYIKVFVMNDTVKSKFSIFDPVVAYEHREFYEQIVNELNVILPVCNQGKCLAAEISRNIAEQETIKELMERVERFRGELLEGTKNLFAQFYQSKDAFHKMIQSTVAYVKINLMDRNLLERSCDVRWWALEIAFCNCIARFNKDRDNLNNLYALTVSYTEMLEKQSRELIRKKTGFFEGLGSSRIRKLAAIDKKLLVMADFVGKIKGLDVLFDAKKYEEFRESCNSLQSVFAEHDEEKNILDLQARVLEDIRILHTEIAYANERLETINRSYTLYRDLVICDNLGNIIATSNKERRAQVQGLNIADEKWFKKAMQTADGTEYYAQDFAPSAVEEQNSLIYSTAVRIDGQENNDAIGAMGIFFDFQDEAGIILADYIPKNSGIIEEGWCSFFSNSNGLIIASSDEDNYDVGAKTHIPSSHLKLSAGETTSSYGYYNGQDAALFTAKTDGYLDYRGLGWSSHVILPRRFIFSRNSTSSEENINIPALLNSCIIPEINKKTYVKVEHDKRAMQLISTNGMLFAAELGSSGQALSPIFEQITKTGDFATSCMEDLLQEMAIDELNLNFQTLELFSKQAIDLIDRNLFERSADIRWWSTDKYLIDALREPTEQSAKDAGQRLKVINGSYTMYRNLILVDASGTILACSSPSLLGGIKHVNVSAHEWFEKGMQTQNNTEYAVADVQDSELEPTKNRSLVYSSGVRVTGTEADAIGVLGILFDWDTEAGMMLQKCLPRNSEGEKIKGSVAFYTNKNGEIIESTDQEAFPVGQRHEKVASICNKLGTGESNSTIIDIDSKQYIIGSTKTKGYREYEGLEWSAHVLRPF